MGCGLWLLFVDDGLLWRIQGATPQPADKAITCMKNGRAELRLLQRSLISAYQTMCFQKSSLKIDLRAFCDNYACILI